MPLHPNFPRDPHAILLPEIRWYPGNDIPEMQRGNLLPPLVEKIRHGIKLWRDNGYDGACNTTRSLLKYWFMQDHFLPSNDGMFLPFRYYFCQREAVESVMWLYEIRQARDPYALIQFDSSGAISKGMFDEDWTRYVIKMATGAGKTKVMSLLITWSYFHKRYEKGSDMSTNFLLIAPNIIVLDRLLDDFKDLNIFYADPVLPYNGYEGQNWQDDFQVTLHLQDEIGNVSDTGNIFLTNTHRVFIHDKEQSINDHNTIDYFLGKRPTGATNKSKVDLGRVVREVHDLVIINDEAHHIHDRDMAWFKNIEDITHKLRLKGSKLSAQFDLSATPKRNNGGIFVQTISDYPLVEAIRQGVVKTPALPDEPSRAKLQERQSDSFIERYEDYIHLGYLEWRRIYNVLKRAGKKSVMFVMTDDTRNCDEVGEWLERKYPELNGAVLVIHTNNNGEISESPTGKSPKELDMLRECSRKIDKWKSPYKAIVSVMVLREGWDVQNVVSIVGLRPFKSKSQILPEQTLGRGLRRMFRGKDFQEKVSVIGTEAFMDFVESIKIEGVELEYIPMGEKSKPQSPIVVEVDRENHNKDIDTLDIELPVLSPRIDREYKNINVIDVDALPTPRLHVKTFTPDEQREIIFKDIDTEQTSHTTIMDINIAPTYQSVIGYFAKTIMRDLRLVGGFDILFGKLKLFIEDRLFSIPVKLDQLNILRNLSEITARKAIIETFKVAVNSLTIQDKGTTEVRDFIKLSKTRPFLVNNQKYIVPKKSIFNKIVGDNNFELAFATFLDGCNDIISFVKNSESTYFKIEYRTAESGIANYYPDFVVKQTDNDVWIIETKGREDLEDPEKWNRLKQWCKDASVQNVDHKFQSLFVQQEQFEKYRPKNFKELIQLFYSMTEP